jgi:hypothetical protein
VGGVTQFGISIIYLLPLNGKNRHVCIMFRNCQYFRNNRFEQMKFRIARHFFQIHAETNVRFILTIQNPRNRIEILKKIKKTMDWKIQPCCYLLGVLHNPIRDKRYLSTLFKHFITLFACRLKLVSGPFMYLDRNKLIIGIRRQWGKRGVQKHLIM